MKLDESKLKILELLVKPKTVTEVAKQIGLSKATVSHHLKSLQQMGLVKVVSTEIERNFIRKYYISALSDPDPIRCQEETIFREFQPTKEGFVRTLLRLVNVMYSDNGIMLKKAGFDIGYHIVAERINGKIDDGLADFWEKIGLGRVVESGYDRFTIKDCYNCSGLPNVGKTYCKIDEGIIEGVMRKKTGKYYVVKETKCWGTGDEVCEFYIRRV